MDCGSMDFGFNHFCPITELMKVFHDLYPQSKVKLVYIRGTEDIPIKAGVDFGRSIIEEAARAGLVIEEVIENIDWEDEGIISSVQIKGETIILIDWEATVKEAVTVLLELLPRSITDYCPYREMRGNYSYRVAKQRLNREFRKRMDEYNNFVFNQLDFNNADIEVVYTLLDDLDEYDGIPE